mgnify:CR=1 FL=1
MDYLRPFLPLLGVGLAFLCMLLLVAGVVRVLRTRRLSQVTLEPEQIRQLQIELTEAARRESTQPGMHINLLPFWKGSRIKEADRQAVINPLIDSRVFTARERRSASEFENMWNDFWRRVWRPTPYEIVVSQSAREGGSRGNSVTVINQKVLGGIDMSVTDNSVNFGPRTGRDVVGGDNVGHDKAGRDARGVRAGGSVVDSANAGYLRHGGVDIGTPNELAKALTVLAAGAKARGESSDVVEALMWCAARATSSTHPDPRDQAKRQRALDRAGEWVQIGLQAIAEGVTGALAGHWIVSILSS